LRIRFRAISVVAASPSMEKIISRPPQTTTRCYAGSAGFSSHQEAPGWFQYSPSSLNPPQPAEKKSAVMMILARH
jgi:hypothetical protein